MENSMKKIPENLNETVSWNLVFRNFFGFFLVSYKVCVAPQSGSAVEPQLYFYLKQLGLLQA